MQQWLKLWEPGEWHYTRFLVPNTQIGRPWCLLSRVPQTRPTSDPIQDQGPLMSFRVAQRVRHVFAARGWTCADGTVRHVHGQVSCRPEQPPTEGTLRKGMS